jgi:hypothetical protein
MTYCGESERQFEGYSAIFYEFGIALLVGVSVRPNPLPPTRPLCYTAPIIYPRGYDANTITLPTGVIAWPNTTPPRSGWKKSGGPI